MLRRPIARAARPGLLRTAATTAVVAGTATAVSGRVARRQQASANQAAEAQAYEQQQQMADQQAYAQPAPPPTSQADMIDELKELAALKEQGVLTEAEFAAQKAKILGA
jgi:type II secretory pathway pseudopilin PulG